MKNNRYFYEHKLQNKNKTKIAGVDEVGRGCWAGPLVVAACILPVGYKNDEIKDSKKLSFRQRERLFDEIIKNAIDYEIVFITPKDVDKLNPKKSSILGMQQAIGKLRVKPDYVLIDAEQININIPHTSIIGGDDKSITIAAASILAKVTRDRYMVNIHKKYPMYSFDKHKGYGTKLHLLALQKHGPIPEFHRFSYKPIVNLKK